MIGHFLRGHPFQVRNLDRSEKVRSHQKNPKSRLAQKLVGLTILVLLAVSVIPRPAAGGQKSAPEVAKSNDDAALGLVKEALTNAVADSFGEDLNGPKTRQFFEGWRDSDWRSFLEKNRSFYMGAKKLNAEDSGLALFRKQSSNISGAIAETYHWVQWRKKFEQIAEVEKYTDIEFLDEKALSKMFPNSSGQRCDGLAIAKKSGNPSERVILGVFESKLSASRVESKQIQNFLEQIRDYYRVQGVSLIRLPNRKTKLIQQIDDFDSEIFIKAAKSFHEEAAKSLTGENSLHFLFNKVSSVFAGNVMGLDAEQKQLLLEEALPLKKLAEFTKKYEQLPKAGGKLPDEDYLGTWLSQHLKEHGEAIKAYLRGPGGIDKAKLEWMFEVRDNPWKKQLPEFAEFVRVNKRFPTRGQDALEGERTLAPWLARFLMEYKEEIKAYLRGRTDINQAELEWMFEVRDNPWKKQLPDVAEFIRVNKRFPILGKDASEGERTLAAWLARNWKEYQEEIKSYLRGRTDINQAELEWMFEVRDNPWKEQLPEFAEFLRVNKRIPSHDAKDPVEDARATWLKDHWKAHEKAIKAYLIGPGGIDHNELEWMFEVKANPWKVQLPEFAKFVRVNKRFPTQGKGALEGERTLAKRLSKHLRAHKEEILAYLDKHVEKDILLPAREDWESRRPGKPKSPATDSNPDLGTDVNSDLCEELKAIGLAPAA